MGTTPNNNKKVKKKKWKNVLAPHPGLLVYQIDEGGKILKVAKYFCVSSHGDVVLLVAENSTSYAHRLFMPEFQSVRVNECRNMFTRNIKERQAQDWH